MSEHPINPVSISDFSPTEQDLLRKHLSLVIQTNKTLNLTRITSHSEGLILHIEDSLSAWPEFKQAPEGLYGDIGSGAGFPGIPLSIVSGRETILVDSVKKKMSVVDKMIRALELENQITTYNGRIEELAIQKRNSFSILTARALSSLPSLLELSSPLLKINGQLICYKAQLEDSELLSAKKLESVLGLSLLSSREFLLSNHEAKRCILVFQKYKEAEKILPRKNGLAQRRPL